MKDTIAELYSDWLVEQNLLEVSVFEEQQELFKELAERDPVSPDWSTWCQTLCC